jgi:hypothetical protein
MTHRAKIERQNRIRSPKKDRERPFRKIPCEVTFHYPDGTERTGMVVAATRARIHNWRTPYATRIELIKFNDDEEEHVRFAYARRSKGKWRFASQTTWSFSVGITRSAIREAEKTGLFGSSLRSSV